MGLFLGEHPQDEASFAVWFEGGGDDGVVSGRQLEALTHLPQVDEGLTASHRRCPQQDVWAQVDVTATFILTTEELITTGTQWEPLLLNLDQVIMVLFSLMSEFDLNISLKFSNETNSPHQEPEKTQKQTSVKG